ncbi:MAG: tRNA (adenosine(37)-N6)-dimethylallyltransferase MiaA [Pseudomonadota bacterium]
MTDASETKTNPVIVVAGATGSGKSALALALARAFGGAIVNADSQQVYRELRILTARPTAAEEAQVPHSLFGCLSASMRCSAGRWLGLALDAIAQIRRAGQLPIVAGGTGLYLKALLEGIAEVPPVPPEAVRAAVARLADIGGEAFRAELAARDPESAARLHSADRQRLVRAMTVVQATGVPLREWQRQAKDRAPNASPVGRFLILALAPPRAALNAALDARFQAMKAAGALDEVRALAAFHLDPTLPALKAVGVAQLLAHLRGEATLDEAVAQAQRATRQFAKRQETWLRGQLRADHVFAAFGASVVDQARAEVERFLGAE